MQPNTIAATGSCHRTKRLVILAPIESFYFSHIGLDPGRLQLLDGLSHRSMRPVVAAVELA